MDACKYIKGNIEKYNYNKRGYESQFYYIGVEKKSIIECFDKALNKIIWTRRIDEFGIINSYDINGNILSTRPNEINREIWSDNDFVFIPFAGAELACLNIKTGETIWFKNEVKIYTIVIYDQYLYANGHGKLYQIEKSNGVIINEICTTNYYPNFQAQLPLYINDEVILLAMVRPGRVMIIDRKKFEYIDDVDLPDENVGIPNSRGSLEWRDNHLFVLTVGNKVHVYKSEDYNMID